MFDMQKIGKRINDLRKSKNMTQMELADKLGISFQAVSNWERGNTMPDISKLSDIAELFEITIDDLLSGEDKKTVDTVKTIADGEPVKEIDAETLADVAPIINQKQFNEAKEKINKKMTIGDVIGLAPFMDEDDLAELCREYLENGYSISEISGLAPFLDEDFLAELAAKSVKDKKSISEIICLAQFMNEDALAELAKNSINEGASLNELIGLAPFLDEDDLADLVENSFDGNFSSITALLPFLPDDFFKRLIKKYK